MWRRLLIEWPARVLTLWWTAYTLVIAMIIMVVVTITAIMLVLWTLGIRWGW